MLGFQSNPSLFSNDEIEAPTAAHHNRRESVNQRLSRDKSKSCEKLSIPSEWGELDANSRVSLSKSLYIPSFILSFLFDPITLWLYERCSPSVGLQQKENIFYYLWR